MTDGARIEAGDRALPPAMAHVTPAFKGAWWAGDLAALDRRPRVAIVGSRRPRPDAAVIARRIALDAARAGCSIVSGLAIGIDGVAHRAALDAGGTTIAVLAGGLARVQPASNRDLARDIAGSRTPTGVAAGHHAGARGLVLSEYGAGTEDAMPYRFRERNRIIAALADYVVVVQARHDSGSMRTAEDALSLGVPIGVVPSSPDDPTYAGAIRLIQDGADAVVDGSSLLRRLALHGIVQPDELHPATMVDHPLASILQVPRTVEEAAALAGMRLPDARSLLLDLEDDGLVRHRSDGTWICAGAVS